MCGVGRRGAGVGGIRSTRVCEAWRDCGYAAGADGDGRCARVSRPATAKTSVLCCSNLLICILLYAAVRVGANTRQMIASVCVATEKGGKCGVRNRRRRLATRRAIGGWRRASEAVPDVDGLIVAREDRMARLPVQAARHSPRLTEPRESCWSSCAVLSAASPPPPSSTLLAARPVDADILSPGAPSTHRTARYPSGRLICLLVPACSVSRTGF